LLPWNDKMQEAMELLQGASYSSTSFLLAKLVVFDL
jgi:hypothetical protein